MKREDARIVVCSLLILIALLSIATVSRAAVIDRPAQPGQVVKVNGQTAATIGTSPVLVELPGDDVRLVPTAATQPSTQPTPIPPVVNPLPEPTTPANDPRPVYRIASDALELSVKAATTPRILEIDPAAEQTIRSAVSVRTDGLTIRSADPNRRARVRIVAGDGQYFGFQIGKKDFAARGLYVYTNYTGTDRKGCPALPFMFTSTARNGTIENCYGDNVDQFISLATGSAGTRILNSETNAKTRGQAIWGGGDNQLIDGCTLRSRNEHPIRFGGDGDPKWDASNVFIRNCTLIQTSTKECLSLRKGGPYFVDNVNCTQRTPTDPNEFGYGVRLGYDNGHGEPALGSVTMNRVTIANGILDVKPTARASKLTFNGLTFTGKSNSPTPFSLNNASNVKASGTVFKP